MTRTIVTTSEIGKDSADEMWRSKTFGPIPGIPVGTWWESRYANYVLLFSCLTNSETEKIVAMMLFMRTQDIYSFCIVT